MTNDAEVQSGEPSTPNKSDAQTPISRWHRVRSAVWRVTKYALGLLGLYVLLVVVGLIPVNNNFAPSDEDTGIRIYVQSSEVHADFIVPIKSDVVDWSTTPLFKDGAARYIKRADHVAIGWGDRGFYLQTPDWVDLNAAKVVNAMLLPSRSVMHLSVVKPKESETCKSVVISTEQYEVLVNYIQASFASDSSSPNEFVPAPVNPADIHDGWGSNNFFFEGTGSYHIFNTCNCWVGTGLKKTGVRTAWFTPLPKTVFLHWPKSPVEKQE